MAGKDLSPAQRRTQNWNTSWKRRWKKVLERGDVLTFCWGCRRWKMRRVRWGEAPPARWYCSSFCTQADAVRQRVNPQLAGADPPPPPPEAGTWRFLVLQANFGDLRPTVNGHRYRPKER